MVVTPLEFDLGNSHLWLIAVSDLLESGDLAQLLEHVPDAINKTKKLYTKHIAYFFKRVMDMSFRTTNGDLSLHEVYAAIKKRLTRDRTRMHERMANTPDSLLSHSSPLVFLKAHIKHTDDLRHCNPEHSASKSLAHLLRMIDELDTGDVAQHFIAVKYKDRVNGTDEITESHFADFIQQITELPAKDPTEFNMQSRGSRP